MTKPNEIVLPTEPYTVIVVTWRDPELRAARMFTLSSGGSWASADGVAFEGLDIIDYKIVGRAVNAEPAAGNARDFFEAQTGRAIAESKLAQLLDLREYVDEKQQGWFNADEVLEILHGPGEDNS